MRRIARLCALAVTVIGAVGIAAVAPAIAAPSGSVFSVAEVVEVVQRELAAADQGDSMLTIEDASLELMLVEGGGTKAGSLAVPGADFVLMGKDGGPRPSLKRRLVLDLAATKGARPGASGAAAGGRLTGAIEEVKASVQQAMAAGAGFDLKKLTLDFDFAVERDGKGQPSLIIYARDRRIDPPDIHGVKVRFSAKAK